MFLFDLKFNLLFTLSGNQFCMCLMYDAHVKSIKILKPVFPCNYFDTTTFTNKQTDNLMTNKYFIKQFILNIRPSVLGERSFFLIEESLLTAGLEADQLI